MSWQTKSFTRAPWARRTTPIFLAGALLGLLALAGCVAGRLPGASAAGSTGQLAVLAAAPRSSEARAAAQAALASVKSTANEAPTQPVEFRGFVEFLPGDTATGTYQIAGRMVNVSHVADLKLQLGELAPGAYVQVIGRQRPDGTIDATKLLVKKAEADESARPGLAVGQDRPILPAAPTEIGEPDGQDDEVGDAAWDSRVHGQVETAIVSGRTTTLTVDGYDVVISSTTRIKAEGALLPGSWVQIKGKIQPDGSILATAIQWVHRTPAQAASKGPQSTPDKVAPVPATVASTGAADQPGAKGRGPDKEQGRSAGHAQNHGKGQH